MSEQQKELLFIAWDYCDDNDKSTEFMLQYMSDFADVDYDDVVEFIIDDEINNERMERYNKSI